MKAKAFYCWCDRTIAHGVLRLNVDRSCHGRTVSGIALIV
jgi:hypothetical protein